MGRLTTFVPGIAGACACAPALAAVTASAFVEARVGGSDQSDAGAVPGSYAASVSTGGGAPSASASLSWATNAATTTFAFSGTASGAPLTLANSNLVVQFTLSSESEVWITWDLSNVPSLSLDSIAGWSISPGPSDPFLYALTYIDGDPVPTTAGGVSATAIGAGPTGFLGLIPAGSWIFTVGIQMDRATSGGFSVTISLPAPAAAPLMLAAAVTANCRRRRR